MVGGVFILKIWMDILGRLGRGGFGRIILWSRVMIKG